MSRITSKGKGGIKAEAKSQRAGRRHSNSSSGASFQADFARRATIPDVTPSDAFGIYALSLFVDEPDVMALAGDALVGGSNDKSADFIYIESDSGRAFIGQSYLAADWGKQEAKAKKAASLSTAVNWLLSTPLAKIPPALRQHAADLRKGIEDGSITKLYLLYTHNCRESKNVRAELDTVVSGARPLCTSKVTVYWQELGLGPVRK